MALRTDIETSLSTLLEVGRFKDYGPNGVQVEGKPVVHKVVSGVTASLALIDAAIAEGADALLVHHGLFWRGQDGRVTGWMKQRLARLLAHDITLYAYHLPLDAHPTLGNNAQLGLRLGLVGDGRWGEQTLGWIGAPDAPVGSLSVDELAERAQTALGRAPVVAPGDGRPLRRKAISSPPSRPGPMPSSRVKFPSRKRTWRANAAWPFWPAATTPPSATARRRWAHTSPRNMAWTMSSLTCPTRRDPPRLIPP
jgi:putative NIF3 family GTP cyclohydrolase 1 type 2